MKLNTAPTNRGKNIYSSSPNVNFDSACKPDAADASGNLVSHLEVDLDECPFEFCSWTEKNKWIQAGPHTVPSPGCRMKKMMKVKIEVTISGTIDSYHELQSHRVDDKDGYASDEHRHFVLTAGKLTLKFLRLTWGNCAGDFYGGGSILMTDGTLALNFVYFDGSKTSGTHAQNGGAIYVKKGAVTISDSTFEGWRASSNGGAMWVKETTTAMTIESTTFRNNWATVRFFLFNLSIQNPQLKINN